MRIKSEQGQGLRPKIKVGRKRGGPGGKRVREVRRERFLNRFEPGGSAFRSLQGSPFTIVEGIVEDAIGAARDPLSVSGGIPGKARAWGKGAEIPRNKATPHTDRKSVV